VGLAAGAALDPPDGELHRLLGRYHLAVAPAVPVQVAGADRADAGQRDAPGRYKIEIRVDVISSLN
jgi:hypothetical protein